MAKEKKENRMYPINGIRICFDHEGETLAGRAYSKMTEAEIKFESSSQMLLEVDRLFDQCGYPQRFMEARSFQKKAETTSHYKAPKSVVSDEEILEKKGKYFTVDVIVQSRRKAGWQGIVCQPDGRMIDRFESELELLKLLTKLVEKQQAAVNQ